jgi:16S rRNA (cytosine967-C5)-methyltransferase
MAGSQRALPREAPGLAARRIALDILDGVLRHHRPSDDHFSGPQSHPALPALEDRDRALVRMLVATVLRRLGTLRQLVGAALDSGYPKDAPRIELILLLGAAQLLFMEVPDHAAVDLAVRLTQADRRGARYVGLINAVLRRIARDAPAALASLDAGRLDTPEWLMVRWVAHYGEETAAAVARVHGYEPPLDLTVKSDAESWAQRLRGRVVSPTGSVRTVTHGPVSRMPGFAEGEWWVQDTAATIPARLLGDIRGIRVADLCAAPGGKTAQLAWAGATVTAVDRSPARLSRLTQNLARLGLSAEVVAADAKEWQAEPFDAVLLDAPCSSTGTIRRHPDVAYLKHETDIHALAETQRRLLDHAVELVRPGGTLVYCSCSLEPEEGEMQIEALLARDSRVRRRPVSGADLWGHDEFVTAAGDLRTLPCHLPDSDSRMAGLDGFYAARLERI